MNKCCLRKASILILALSLTLLMSACGQKARSGAESAKKPPANDAGSWFFSSSGHTIRLHDDMETVLTALGEPDTYTETASCAFEGKDKTYGYESFFITTYPDGDKDYVSAFWFCDETALTPEGLHIGSTAAQVEAVFGAGSIDALGTCSQTRGDGRLVIVLKDGVVSSIRYGIILE